MLSYNIYDTSQVKSIYNYLNIKRKVLICNADIDFNKKCLIKKVTPKYAKVKFSGNSKPNKLTKSKAEVMRVKFEIKHLYKKNNF
jgi:hypothetical protein